MKCHNCKISYKLEQCCSVHPETGESILNKLNSGREIYSCPSLNSFGKCGIYEDRPSPCREYFCPKIEKLDLVDLLKY